METTERFPLFQLLVLYDAAGQVISSTTTLLRRDQPKPEFELDDGEDGDE